MSRTPSNTIQIAIRIPEDWIRRADALVQKLGRPGVLLNRTDVFRILIAEGLEAIAKAAEKKR